MATRREKVDSFLSMMNTAFPLIKKSQRVDEVNLNSNAKFIKATSALMSDFIKKTEFNLNKRNQKANIELLKCSNKKKFLIDGWIRNQLFINVNNVYSSVIHILQDSIIVDFLDEDEKWLDIDYPLYMKSKERYDVDEQLLEHRIKCVYASSEDFVDYVTLLVSKYIFLFTRKLDENSKTQILGNIGGLEDIRRSVEYVFIGEILNRKQFTSWYNTFLGEYKEIMLQPEEKFIKIINSKKNWPMPKLK